MSPPPRRSSSAAAAAYSESLPSGAPLVVVKHATPGRIRMSVRGLRRSPELATRLTSLLAEHGELRLVSVSEVTGTVLVTHGGDLHVERFRDTLEAAVARMIREAASGRPLRLAVARQPEIGSRQRPGRPLRVLGMTGPPASTSEPAWHTLDEPTFMSRLGVTRAGLAAADVRERRERHGANVREQAAARGPLTIFMGQLTSLPVAVLAGSAVVSALSVGLVDAALIGVVLLANAAVGFHTESRAERILSSLGDEAEDPVTVVRDGARVEVDPSELVVSDVVVVSQGPVPADLRLLESARLTVDEAALTGESLPVDKRAAPLPATRLALADRHSMLYAGTTVTGGSGLGVVVATGSRTELGRVQALVASVTPPETPMQRELRDLGGRCVKLSLGVCAGVVGLGLLRGMGLGPTLKTGVSLAIAAVPEGLPAVGTTTLAFGVARMRRRNVVARQLAAIEALGSIDVLCLDKTGTLTANRMAVTRIVAGTRYLRVREGGFYAGDAPVAADALPELERLLRVAALCNEAEPNGDGLPHKGSPTETALLRMAEAGGVDVRALRAAHPRTGIRHRTEHAAYMSTAHELPDGRRLVAVKGSPSEILGRASSILVDGEVRPLDERRRAQVEAHNEHLGGKALRVLALAYKEDDGEGRARARDLVLVGLVGLKDPPREGIRELIDAFHAAGIATMMMTGDQEATATAIGHELGFNGDGRLRTIDASALGDGKDLAAAVDGAHVFARVSPSEKLAIVRALRSAGRSVAMIGDGVNDSPALKAADVGVAMGNGTRAAREAAGVVLEGDNLVTMLEAVREGRAIRANLAKALRFLLATNAGEIALTVGGILSGRGSPLTAMQLLWLNLLTDVFPALALALDPADPDVLTRPAVPPGAPLLSDAEQAGLLADAAFLAAGPLAAFHLAARRDPARASSLALMTMTIGQYLHMRSVRARSTSRAAEHLLEPNPWATGAVLVGVTAQVLALLVPGLSSALGLTLPTTPRELALLALGAGVPYALIEARRHAVQPDPV